jgi:hypothetical protein
MNVGVLAEEPEAEAAGWRAANWRLPSSKHRRPFFGSCSLHWPWAAVRRETTRERRETAARWDRPARLDSKDRRVRQEKTAGTAFRRPHNFALSAVRWKAVSQSRQPAAPKRSWSARCVRSARATSPKRRERSVTTLQAATHNPGRVTRRKRSFSAQSDSDAPHPNDREQQSPGPPLPNTRSVDCSACVSDEKDLPLRPWNAETG